MQVTGGEAMYDQRLFNQDAGGAGAGGMGGEDSYNIYDKPLFADRAELFKHKVRHVEGWWRQGGGVCGLVVEGLWRQPLLGSGGCDAEACDCDS